MDIRSIAVEETSFLHLNDANDEPLFEGGDRNKPIGITLYGPGSKVHARASAAKHGRIIDRLKKKGKTELSAEEEAEENAAFLAACTKSFHYIEIGDLQGESLFKAVYADESIGFIGEQAAAHLKQWGNFSKGSPKN